MTGNTAESERKIEGNEGKETEEVAVPKNLELFTKLEKSAMHSVIMTDKVSALLCLLL